MGTLAVEKTRVTVSLLDFVSEALVDLEFTLFIDNLITAQLEIIVGLRSR